MCYAKPGPRCSAHLAEKIAKVTKTETDLRERIKSNEILLESFVTRDAGDTAALMDDLSDEVKWEAQELIALQAHVQNPDPAIQKTAEVRIAEKVKSINDSLNADREALESLLPEKSALTSEWLGTEAGQATLEQQIDIAKAQNRFGLAESLEGEKERTKRAHNAAISAYKVSNREKQNLSANSEKFDARERELAETTEELRRNYDTLVALENEISELEQSAPIFPGLVEEGSMQAVVVARLQTARQKHSALKQQMSLDRTKLAFMKHDLEKEKAAVAAGVDYSTMNSCYGTAYSVEGGGTNAYYLSQRSADSPKTFVRIMGTEGSSREVILEDGRRISSDTIRKTPANVMVDLSQVEDVNNEQVNIYDSRNLFN